MRRVLFALILATPAVAHADLWTRAVPQGPGGGGAGSGSAAASADDADLIAWAGEPRAISLGELLQLAVRQAPALQSARIDIEVAEAQITETFARHDWTVAAQATGSETHGFFSGLTYTSRAYGLSADVSRVLPTGGTIDLHVSSQYQKSESAMFGTSKDWIDTVSGSINQPLLKGRGAELYNATERKLSIVRDSAVLARRLAAINTIQNVVSAYWDLVLAERQVAITEQSLALARERLRVTQIGASGGKIAQAEIPAVQQIIAT
ncbi:MAG: TolC family protein, partial [Deltaproteobacteria bacterium]|nr:TolC family protein [Deltaproteobacteria bacterium]